MLRGAPISDEEQITLNLNAGKLFESLGIDMIFDDYDEIREYDYVGYAHYYLKKSWTESELRNNADVAIYKQLLEIDAKIGTTQSEQLRWCLSYSPRKDLIEVRTMFLILKFKIF